MPNLFKHSSFVRVRPHFHCNLKEIFKFGVVIPSCVHASFADLAASFPLKAFQEQWMRRCEQWQNVLDVRDHRLQTRAHFER